jgi:hypothetical protein
MMKKLLCVLSALLLVVTLLPVCKSDAIFRHKAIGITVGLNFVKILQFFFLFCESSVIIGTFQGEDVE